MTPVDAPARRGRATLEADPGLRFAAAALEPATVGPYLGERLGPHTLRRADLLRHKPGRRALLRYTLTRPGGTLQVLGKVRAKGTDHRTQRLQAWLWANGFDDSCADGVSAAEPLGTVDAFHMTLQRAVPGRGLETLLTADAKPLLGRVAEALYRLHRTPAPVCRRHTVHDELEILSRQLGAVSAASPQYRERLERLLAASAALAAGLPAAPEATLHRDFYPDQVLVGGGRLYLLDLDLCARGDPALDVGNFVAHLREHALRRWGNPDALAELAQAFTSRYRELTGLPAAAADGYASLSLARHVAISQRLPERRHLTGDLLALTEAQLERLL